MNILYLHGLNGNNISERTEWLSKYGKLINPKMDYKNYIESFKFLEKLVIKYKIDVVVGSSMGGFLGFHLANYYGLSSILLNPALLITNIVNPNIKQFAKRTLHYISLGKQDDIIPNFTTKAVLEETGSRAIIKEYNMGHETNFDVFLDICKTSGLFDL